MIRSNVKMAGILQNGALSARHRQAAPAAQLQVRMPTSRHVVSTDLAANLWAYEVFHAPARRTEEQPLLHPQSLGRASATAKGKTVLTSRETTTVRRWTAETAKWLAASRAKREPRLQPTSKRFTGTLGSWRNIASEKASESSVSIVCSGITNAIWHCGAQKNTGLHHIHNPHKVVLCMVSILQTKQGEHVDSGMKD
eukprot:TRINITY_DN42432_c0_g1_i1.p1 TRINITY_DN42432_c0_g1~~TRINITY_DN42432_c0_g1_i1.p1  ORF type:complete len:197 (-),score=26.28 TRINITY_DN42432_c0_g1_i1:357-947(-)